MVLYEKNGNFIGMGKDELSFLGFEDFDEFKSEHKDFADLFVNKPGYIFKFKNFSWIDYTLHSGAPKKSVVIKLKNGQEVETGLKISEIFLNNPQNNQETYYCVELSQNNFQPTLNTEPKVTLEDIEKPLEVYTTPTEETEEVVENKISLDEDFSVDYEDEELTEESQAEINEDYKPNIENQDLKLKIDLDEDFETDNVSDVTFGNDNLEEETQEKLSINENIFENNSISTISEESEVEKPLDNNSEIKLKLNLDEEDEGIEDEDSNQEALFIQDYDEAKEEIPVDTSLEKESVDDEKLEFDLTHCAEELGLDLSEIAEILEDYIQKIDNGIPKIENALENENLDELKGVLIPIKSIADTLNIKVFSNILERMISSDFENNKKLFKQFQKFSNELKEDLL